MKRSLFILCATTLLIAPWHVQGQSAPAQTDISAWEYRQVLVDLGTYLDAHKGTDLRRQFEALSDEMLMKLHSATPNRLQLQSAVAALKKHDAGLATASLVAPRAQANLAGPADAQSPPTCGPPNTIIDIASGAVCTPAYPDPANTAWQDVVDPIRGVNAFSPSDYNSVKSQACGLTVEANLQQITVTFQGLYNSLTPVCAIIPAPLNAVCLVPLTLVAVADSVSAGLFADCVEQDGLVNAAEIDAGFRNTITIYNNLKGVDTHLTTANTEIDNRINSLSTQVTNVGTQLTNVNTQITGEFSALDTHVTNIDNHVANEFTALDAHLVTLINQLTNQVGQGTQLLGADLRQVMKLLLTPDGLKAINPAILTCTGANCPNVLANCPAAGCSWNNVGPLP